MMLSAPLHRILALPSGPWTKADMRFRVELNGIVAKHQIPLAVDFHTFGGPSREFHAQLRRTFDQRLFVGRLGLVAVLVGDDRMTDRHDLDQIPSPRTR